MPDHLAAYLVTVYVLVLIPGPSVLFVVSRGVALGRGAALATVVGNAAGLVLQLALVAAGLGAIVTESETALTVLEVAGGVYLVLLGLRTIRDRRLLAQVAGRDAASPRSLRQIVREGFVVGLTNPKSLIIFVAVLPRFADRDHETVHLLVLGAIFVTVALLSDGAWALASGTARRLLAESQTRLEWLTAIGGATLVMLGAALAFLS